jgi:nitrogen fixation protein FixH
MSGTIWFANEIRGRHVLIGFIAFFGLIFLANGIFLYYALTTFGGGEKGSPYRSGLHYNEMLAEAVRAAERGLSAALAYDAKAGRLTFNLRDKSGEPVAGLHFDANVGRPATDREDLSAEFREVETGRYVAELALAPGQWVVELRSDELSREGDATYRLKQRVIVPEAP